MVIEDSGSPYKTGSFYERFQLIETSAGRFCMFQTARGMQHMRLSEDEWKVAEKIQRQEILAREEKEQAMLLLQRLSLASTLPILS